MKQLNFSTITKHRNTFGGSLINAGTHPKTARPLASKLPVHLVLRAERSAMRTPRMFRRVNDLVASTARRNGVRIYEYANVGNHLHLLLKLPRRAAWRPFIRALTGQIATLTGARWLRRPFTRVVSGGRRAFCAAREYVRLNRHEAEHGVSRREARDEREIERLILSG